MAESYDQIETAIDLPSPSRDNDLDLKLTYLSASALFFSAGGF
jgi:hypothetical protein